jgi:hypothetical protein
VAAGIGLSVARVWGGPEPQATARVSSPSPLQAKVHAPASEPSAKRADVKAVVPFEMLPTNHMLVEARINDKGPYLLIFDLGAPITLLSNRASEATGVVKANAPRSFLFAMRGEAEINKLQVGELTTAKLPVIVFDHPVLKALEDISKRRIDGIMGFTFFARYKTTIDYLDHRMTFEPINYKVRNLIKELPERLMGPKVARRKVLSPSALWGLRLGKPVRGIDSPGVPVAMVFDHSPADRAGLKPGDVLVALNGRWTVSVADVFRAAADVQPGHDADVVILRDGKERTLKIHPVDGV